MPDTFGDFYRGRVASLTANNADFQPLFNTNPSISGIVSLVGASAEFSSIVNWVHGCLGEPILVAEIDPSQIAGRLEQSILKFSSIVNFYFIQSYAASILGIKSSYTEYDFSQALPAANNAWLNIFMANQFVNQGLYNESTDKRRGYLNVAGGVQRYDIYTNGIDVDTGLSIDAYAASVTATEVHFKTIYHGAGAYMNRLYDPTSNQQFIQAEFGFPSFPTDTVFYILPLWQDLARGQLLSASDYTRKSAFKHNIYNRTIELIPRPQMDFTMWFDFYTTSQPIGAQSPLQQSSFSGLSYLAASAGTQYITSLGNAPIKDLTYETMNSASRTWVREYTLALCMETLALTRGKMPWVLPGGETITLNADALFNLANQAKTQLEAELKEHLLAMDSYTLLQKEADKSDMMMKILKNNSPMPIYRTRI